MELLEKVGSQVPALTVLVIQSFMFLRAQKEDRVGFLQMLKEVRDSQMSERKEVFDRLNIMHSEHLAARQDSRTVIAQVATAMQGVSVAIATLEAKTLK